MLWLLIPLMLGLLLISITQLPRAIVLSAIIEYRYFKRQPSYAKQLSKSLKTILIATWLVLGHHHSQCRATSTVGSLYLGAHGIALSRRRD